MNIMPVKNQDALALIIVLQTLFILTITGLISLKTILVDIMISGNIKDIKRAFYIAEAGSRHATEYLRQNLENWDDYKDHQVLLNTTPFAHGKYYATIEDAGANRRKIVSIGITDTGAVARVESIFVPLCNTYSHFDFGIFGHEGITINGAGYMDSYDSSIAPWTWETHNENCDLGTNSIIKNAITLNDGEVYGDAAVGYTGDPNTGIRTVGGAVIFGNESSLPAPKDLTPVTDPGGGTPETLHIASGLKTLTSGIYRLPHIWIGNAAGIIDGDVTLYVDDYITILGKGELRILPGGSLKIYVSGDILAGGKGIVNTTMIPERLIVYGTKSCTQVTVSGSSNFYGVIYAPNADNTLGGDGDFYGSMVGKSITVTGTGNFHYDENLKDLIAGCRIYDFDLISMRRT